MPKERRNEVGVPKKRHHPQEDEFAAIELMGSTQSHSDMAPNR